MQIFEMDILGCLSVVLDYPNAKGKQSLPLYNVVYPLGDWLGPSLLFPILGVTAQV